MLNKQKVFQQLQAVMPQFFLHTTHEKDIAHIIWKQLTTNKQLLDVVCATKSEWILPTWSGDLDAIVPVRQDQQVYSCIAVDGSQIYPDKHQGTICYLLNIGTVQLTYADGPSNVILDSIPSVHASHWPEHEDITPDIVNCKRSELEFKIGFELMQKKGKSTLPNIFLCDGSLIFWHLESKDEAIKQRFLMSYIVSLELFYQYKLPIAGYISLPKAKDITNLLRIVIEKELLPNSIDAQSTINTLVDADIVSLFLPPWHRTQIFANNAPITQYYPAPLKPHFLYLNVVDEIVRIEIPAWVAQDAELLEMMLAIIVDQCIKGRGYPVALAEAHEQAVVKAADREYFYQLLYKVSIDNNQKLSMSQKMLKKRLVGI